MNPEYKSHKIGTIGEFLVKIKLNAIGVNTGSVDRDTGTDITMFYNGSCRTAQVKTGRNRFNYGNARGVDYLIMVKLNWEERGLNLDEAKYRIINIGTGEMVRTFDAFKECMWRNYEQ